MRKTEIRKYWREVNSQKIPSSLSLDMEFERLHQSSKIIDIGCGNCEDLRNLAKYGFHNLYGIDINKDICLLREEDSIQYSVQDATKLSFKNNSFDYAIMKALLTVLVTDNFIFQSLQEAYRILKKGSTLHIEDFFQNWHLQLYRNRYLKYSKQLKEDCSFPVYDSEGKLRYYARHFDVHDISTMLVKIGFTIEDIKFKYVTTQSGNNIIGFRLIAIK